LFRRNSMATKMFSSYAKVYGKQYLQKVLVPILNDLIAKNLTFEIDPTKVGNGKDNSEALKSNLRNLLDITDRFLMNIIDSIKYCPV